MNTTSQKMKPLLPKAGTADEVLMGMLRDLRKSS
jgi:hypothetical protein